MNVLTVFYSRSGTTRKVAESITKVLSCDIEEIVDTKNRTGPLAYIVLGRAARNKELAEIQPAKKDPSLYDVVLIGTPVWANNMSTPIRTYITQNRERFRKVGFFCTCGGTGADKTLESMKDLCGKETLASVAIRSREMKGEKYLEKINEFLAAIRGN